MITLSLCMIVKNEEDVIARCLDSVHDVFDEIIIVDTGSTDKTKEIIERYTKNIHNFKWINDFSAARNFAFSKAKKDYIMWLDADDVVDEYNRTQLLELKKTLNESVDMVMMKYDVAFDENNNPTFSYYRERIFKRRMNFKWIGEIHEVIPQNGNVIFSEISVLHKKIHPNEPQRNLKIFQQMIADKKIFDPRQKYYYARELYYNGKYDEAIEIFNEFLIDGKGWIENNISACIDLAMCYYIKNKHDAAISALFKTFIYDSPRAEVCCHIGKHFFDIQKYNIAIFWYELASTRPLDDKSGAFVLADSYGYTPYMQLCVCYDILGDKEKAKEYNEKAGKIKPKDKSYLSNKKYFATLN